MFSRKPAALVLLLAALSVRALSHPIAERQERVIAGGPNDSMEVRHLVLRGTNEEIGRALADLARERFGVRAERSSDPVRTRAARRYIEINYPILAERMRGVAAAYGHKADDDTWDHSQIGYTDLRAGCSIVHLPPKFNADGRSVVSRDYDFSTGSLSFGPLEPGMLHPTARPFLLELHPDRGYASLAMVAYDLLSGALDGINSEGLTVTLAMDDEIFSKQKIEPSRGPSAGLAELQTIRFLLDTCANVEEAKEALMRTKQYYQYVPVHYLVADRFGKSFVWEYSESHNREYIIKDPGRPLMMTNFTLHKHMDGEKPPTAELARATCKRYAYLADHLTAPVTEGVLRATHAKIDAQAAGKSADRPPERTFWHALYYPEERRAKFSYYLHDDANQRPVRSEYLEFDLSGSTRVAPQPVARVSAPQASAAQEKAPQGAEAIAKLRAGGAIVQIDDGEAVSVGFRKDVDPAPLLPLLRELPRLNFVQFAGSKVTDDALALLVPLAGRVDVVGLRDTAITDQGLAHLEKMPGIKGLNLSGTKVTDAGLQYLKPMSRLTKLNVKNTAVTEAGVREAKKFLPFWATVER